MITPDQAMHFRHALNRLTDLLYAARYDPARDERLMAYCRAAGRDPHFGDFLAFSNFDTGGGRTHAPAQGSL